MFEEKKKMEQVKDIFSGNKDKKMKVEQAAFPILPGSELMPAKTTPAEPKNIFNESSMPTLGKDLPAEEVIVKKGGAGGKGKKRGAPIAATELKSGFF